jgi:cyclic beta-1,2-glucan synthetase
LPKLNFEGGVPDQWRTIVVVPMLLSSLEAIRDEVEQLEVRHLGNPDRNLRFALLADYVDAPARDMPEDSELLDAAIQGIRTSERALRRNSILGDAADTPRGVERFLLFHRERSWCETEQKWMGWERKRGKLEQFNRFCVVEYSHVRRNASRRRLARVGGWRQVRHHAGCRYAVAL